MSLRGSFKDDEEQLFIYKDREPLRQEAIRNILYKCLNQLGINQNLYSFHSLHIGRSSDLCKAGVPVEEVRRLGHWKSNAVYRYIR